VVITMSMIRAISRNFLQAAWLGIPAEDRWCIAGQFRASGNSLFVELKEDELSAPSTRSLGHFRAHIRRHR